MNKKNHYTYNYKKITSDLKKSGFNCDELKRSINILSYNDGGKYFLKEIAYKPTGIALGCPLPNIFSSELENITEKIENKLIETFEMCDNAIAYVPKKSYHITVLNRSHFDHDNTIIPLSHVTKNNAAKIIRNTNINPIKIHFNGIVLTRSGRLLVTGYPLDNKLQQIRYLLSSSLPELCVNIPSLAHIKIGHLLTPFSLTKKPNFLSTILEYGNMIDFIITFTDFYTPLGRIDI